jgi:chaperonin GroEL
MGARSRKSGWPSSPAGRRDQGGGATELEVKERKDRVDDASHATMAGVEEGILPGGGVALLRSAKTLQRLGPPNDDQKTGIEIVRRALQAQTGDHGDMFKKDLIDPAKVVRAALQDGASAAGLLITTEAMVAELSKKQAPAIPSSGAGMDC